MKKAFYPGSLDPITFGHIDIARRALNQFDSLTLGIGVNPDKEWKYMFSLQERMQLVRQALADVLDVDVVAFRWMLPDFVYENRYDPVVRWLRNGQDFEAEKSFQRAIRVQNPWVEVLSFCTTKEMEDISSSAAKMVLKEQWDIRSYVPLNVKQAMEWRMLGQYIAWLTGTIGAWKSYTTSKFVEIGHKNGIPVYDLDMDKIWHDVIWPLQEEGYQEVRATIANIFGHDVQNHDGSIDRKKLGAIAFADPQKLKQLNDVMELPMKIRLRREMYNKSWLLLYNSALVVEAGHTDVVNNNMILVDIDPQTQTERLKKRWYSEQEITRRVSSQYSGQAKQDLFAAAMAKDHRGSLTHVAGTSKDAELEQAFNELLSHVDTFGELRIAWFLTRLWAQGDAKKLFVQLRDLYDRVWNGTGERDEIVQKLKWSYHRWLHVIACLNELYKVKHLLEDPDVIECAILFHDVVYDPKSTTNEEGSAFFADKMMTERWLSRAFIEKVKKMIMVTKDVFGSYTGDAGFMLDIDKSIVGQSPRIYTQYNKDLRREYYMYPYADFNEWRISFLEKLLKQKDNLFQTDYFKETYLSQAMTNISNELDWIKR